MSAPASAILLSLFIALLGACAEPALKDQVSKEFASQELYPVRNSGFTEAFVRRDVNLSSYHSVDIRPLGVSEIDIPSTAIAGTLRRDWQMTAERQNALQTAWAGAMDRAFSSYQRATAGPGVLRIDARLTRIAPGRPTATTIGGDLQPMAASRDVIEISAEFRVYDAGDDTLLAVIRDSRTLTSVQMSRTAPAAVRILFGSWSALLHTRISGR
ncbi:MAG: DUF3313 family protein [Halieaceae bacterium]|nr:DUF3313 family protein [Halieaceae bacterium]